MDKYTHIGTFVTRHGLWKQQLGTLKKRINKTDCDSVIIGTPIDLGRVIDINKPHTRVHYELEEVGSLNLDIIVNDFIKEHGLKK